MAAPTRTLNVDGLAVAPGFIDPHTHLDAQLLWDPLGTSSCFHGVTSVVLGNCGLSLAPAKPENRESVIKSFVRVEAISRRVLEEGVEWKWTSTAEYLSTLGTRLGINAAALIGHIAVRHYVMGEDAVERQATVGRNYPDETTGAPGHGSRRRRFFHQPESTPYPRRQKAGSKPSRVG